MKYIYLVVFTLAAQFAHASCSCSAVQKEYSQTNPVREGFVVERDVAQYKGSDYANVVHVERGITLEEAYDIAESNPDVDYFVYLKGGQLVLEVPPEVECNPENDPFELLSFTNFRYDSGKYSKGYCRIFRHGDVVFFKKEGIWLGSAPGYADAYFKVAK